jgi:hypothetical protein
MLDNAREKEIRLGGTLCLKRKGTKKIKNVEKHILEKKEQHLRIETTNGCILETLVNNSIDITIDVSYIRCVTIGRWSGCFK